MVFEWERVNKKMDEEKQAEIKRLVAANKKLKEDAAHSHNTADEISTKRDPCCWLKQQRRNSSEYGYRWSI